MRMLCEECCETTDDYQTINNGDYCNKCIDKYMLIPCPGAICNNIVSLNGFDGLNDVEDYTCSECDAVFCNYCLIKVGHLKMCNECFNL